VPYLSVCDFVVDQCTEDDVSVCVHVVVDHVRGAEKEPKKQGKQVSQFTAGTAVTQLHISLCTALRVNTDTTFYIHLVAQRDFRHSPHSTKHTALQRTGSRTC
jgi:hypothetical protein